MWIRFCSFIYYYFPVNIGRFWILSGLFSVTIVCLLSLMATYPSTFGCRVQCIEGYGDRLDIWNLCIPMQIPGDTMLVRPLSSC